MATVSYNLTTTPQNLTTVASLAADTNYRIQAQGGRAFFHVQATGDPIPTATSAHTIIEDGETSAWGQVAGEVLYAWAAAGTTVRIAIDSA